MSCYEKGCKEEVAIECFCSNSKLFSCKNHMVSHLLTKTANPHNFNQIQIQASKESKLRLIKEIAKAISSLESFQQNSQKIASELVNIITHKIQQIDSEIYNTILTLTDYAKKIMFSAEYNTNDYFGKLLHETINFEKEITNWTVPKIFEILNENYIINFQAQSYSIHQKLRDVSIILKNINQSTPSNLDFCLCTTTNSRKKIIKLNKQSFNIQEIGIILDEKTKKCLVYNLKNNFLFVGGGYINKNICSNNYYIIDISTGHVKSKFKGNKVTHSSGVIQYEHNVFIFGGKIEAKIKQSQAEKYNLKTSTWHSISPLLCSAELGCPALYNRRIILSKPGWEFFLSYFPENDSYDKIFNNFFISSFSKHFFVLNYEIYLIYKNAIYKCKNNDFNEWIWTCDFKFPDKWNMREYIEYKDKVFLRNEVNIFVFDSIKSIISCIYDTDYSKKIAQLIQ
ncbi:hypothetical protein SteCoe_37981 [Stentor coeruleus]|uniref:Uncharacterized protein n=1 Tax=Stentor coeruleus TaxID=5963 RepID=A0A1R2AM07_9CILI|nr:hypothetical protein SteCoe_37981 [Stentor coeruleus]